MNNISDQEKINFVKACDLLIAKLGCTREEAARKVVAILEGVAK